MSVNKFINKKFHKRQIKYDFSYILYITKINQFSQVDFLSKNKKTFIRASFFLSLIFIFFIKNI